MASLLLKQTFLLFKKNLLLTARSWRATLLQLLAPAVFVLLLFACQKVPLGTQDLNPSPYSVPSIPHCHRFSALDDCRTLVYVYDGVGDEEEDDGNITAAFSEEEIDEIMNLFISDASSGLTANDVWKFNSSEALEKFILDKPNITQTAIVFYPKSVLKTYNYTNWGEGQLPFAIYYNGTTSDIPVAKINNAVTYYLSRAISNYLLNNTAPNSFTVNERSYPILQKNYFDAIPFIGPVAFFCATMANQIVLIQSVANEKEIGLRAMLKQLGVSDMAYFLSFAIFNFLFSLILSLITIGAGAAFQFRFFLYANFPSILITFALFGFAMMPLSVLISIITPSARIALNASLGMFLLGVLVQLIFSVQFLLRILYKPSIVWLAYIFQILWAPFNFARVISDIASATPQNDYGAGNHWTWADVSKDTEIISSTETYTVPATAYSWMWSGVNFCVYTLLSILFYFLIQSEGGQLSNFLVKLLKSKKNKVDGNPSNASQSPNDIDSDVVEEERAANDPSCVSPVRVLQVHKTYTSLFSSRHVKAVRGVSLTVKKGEVFALLGHNSAGKTTLLSVMNGTLEPTEGDVIVLGHSVTREPVEVRKSLGVCPQHDVLWPNLTAREHLRLYALLKNFPYNHEELENEIDQRLEDVLLKSSGNKCTKTFSGGMKRRLSVALACVGKPQCVLLDEPTTGLDPMSRRQIWASITKIKQNSAVILTTHSMEEADALGDRVSIQAAGTLRCLGTSLHLKNKFGLGYQLTITAPEGKGDLAKERILSLIPGSKVLAQTNENLKIGVPQNALDSLAEFLHYVETESNQQSCLIQSWGISQTTLEEVFLRVGIVQESK